MLVLQLVFNSREAAKDFIYLARYGGGGSVEINDSMRFVDVSSYFIPRNHLKEETYNEIGGISASVG